MRKRAKTHPLPLKPPIVMTPTVFSGFELIFALNRTDTASDWASKPDVVDRVVVGKWKRAGGGGAQREKPGGRVQNQLLRSC